ncbi:UNVERIFIED_CONTAM: hypothetical protein BEN50_12795 [Euhalothece sp. KZN 001]
MPLNPEGIVLHTLATPRGWGVGRSPDSKLRDVTEWHVLPKPRGRGWRDIGYNWIIWIDGQESAGRDLDDDDDPWEEIAAHTRGMNRTTIGAAMEPIWTDDQQADGDPWEFFTEGSLMAAQERVRWLFREFPSLEWVAGHNEFAAKACPQFHVPTWWDMETMSWRRSEKTTPHGEGWVDWRRVQKALKERGFPPGPIDGIRGRKTDAALAAYGLDHIQGELG